MEKGKLFDFYDAEYELNNKIILPVSCDYENTNKNNKIIIIGAGPAGLMTALVARQHDYNVSVFERRSRDLKRRNIVNLKPEVDAMLNQLGLLNDFRKEVVTEIPYDLYFDLGKPECEKIASEKKDKIEFEKISELFSDNGIYAANLADIQVFLAKKALERGVKIFSEAQVILGDLIKLEADFIFIADGACGSACENLDVTYCEDAAHPCQNESWVFGNLKYNGHKSFSVVIKDEKNSEASNIIFCANKGLINVQTPFDSKKDVNIKIKIEEIAKLAAEKSGVKLSDLEAKAIFGSAKPVVIKNKIANQVVFENILLVGDRVGSSSPLAGLGATLALSAYPYAVDKFLRDKDKLAYSLRVKSYAKRWLNRSAGLSTW